MYCGGIYKSCGKRGLPSVPFCLLIAFTVESPHFMPRMEPVAIPHVRLHAYKALQASVGFVPPIDQAAKAHMTVTSVGSKASDWMIKLSWHCCLQFITHPGEEPHSYTASPKKPVPQEFPGMLMAYSCHLSGAKLHASPD